MRIVQTLCIASTKNPLNNNFGWSKPVFHLMSWALSVLQLNKIYNKVNLYGNKQALQLLIDMLKLPYAEVFSTHDNLTFLNEDLWALPKIYSYSLQEEPFLHVDGDVFIFHEFEHSLLKGELIAQNLEEATEYYSVMLKTKGKAIL